MSENHLNHYPVGNYREHQCSFPMNNLDNNGIVSYNQTNVHPFTYCTSQDQSQNINNTYVFGTNNKTMSSPNMTPPYVETSSTSEDFMSYWPNVSENEGTSSLDKHMQYPQVTDAVDLNYYNQDHYHETRFNALRRREEDFSDNFVEQPLTPPLDEGNEHSFHPECSYGCDYDKTFSKDIKPTTQAMTTTNESNVNKPLSKWKRKQERERLMLPLYVRQKRRLAANARERKRMTSLNDAFARLRAILPAKQVRSDEVTIDKSKELSKMEALQMAQAYIAQLVEVLNEN